MIQIHCTFSAPIGRVEIEDYIRRLELEIYTPDDDGARIPLGRMRVDQVMLSDIEVDGADLYDVCDVDSQGLHEVQQAIFDDDGKFQPELGVDELSEQLLFVWKAAMHPCLERWEPAIYSAVCTLFGNNTAVAVWRAATQMSDRQLNYVGFRRIAGTELLFLHASYQTDFFRDHPRGVEVPYEFRPPEDAAEWLRKHWGEDDES